MKIAILGVGKLGRVLTEALLAGDNEITLVDINEKRLDDMLQQYDLLTCVGDVHRVSVLRDLDIGSYDFALACTGNDDINIFAASAAKSLGCSKAIARISEPEHIGQSDFICKNFNIDATINPDMLITNEIYRYLVEKYSLSNGVFTNKRIAMIELDANNEPRIVGKPITEFRNILPDTLVVGISRHGQVIIPHGKDTILPGDIVYLVGEKNAMLDYAKKFIRAKSRDAHKVMIIGGGHTGYFLAKKLAEYGSIVKIIERNAKRCRYLSNNLNNVMVLQGNGTDISLLDEENIDEMDAVVTATGFDEENLILAVAAKNRGVEDVICKVSHESYNEMINKLGIDVVLNSMDISASVILRMVNGSKIVLSSVLLQGQAELLEIYVDETMAIINKPLKNLNLPDYAIFAAINRGNETIIPGGDDMIIPGDHLIVVCLLSHISFIESVVKTNEKPGILG